MTTQLTLDAPPLPVGEGALVVIPRAELIFVPGGAEKVLNSIKDKARRETAGLDVSRPRDRDAMRSVAYKLRRLKTTGDDSGKDLKAEYQAKINPIDAERRVWRAEMDELIAEIIAPAEKFDADEAVRVKGHEDALADVLACCVPAAPYTSGMLRLMLDAFGARPTREWQEFSQRATDADAYVRRTLLHMIEVTETAEREAAEFARLREEEAERQRQEAARLQAEREAEIARQAAETARAEAERVAAAEAERMARGAEEARLAAERAAQAERERIAREAAEAAAAAEAERLRIVREAEEAERRAAAALAAEQERAAKAERDRLAAEERARQAALKAEADRVAAARAAEQARIDAAEKAERDRVAAIEAERQRVEGERIQAEAEMRKREANIAHKRKVNREAVDDLVMHADLTTEQAAAVVVALAKKLVRNCNVVY